MFFQMVKLSSVEDGYRSHNTTASRKLHFISEIFPQVSDKLVFWSFNIYLSNPSDKRNTEGETVCPVSHDDDEDGRSVTRRTTPG